MNGLSCQTTTRGGREGGRKGEIQIGVDCLDRQTERERSQSGLDGEGDGGWGKTDGETSSRPPTSFSPESADM